MPTTGKSRKPKKGGEPLSRSKSTKLSPIGEESIPRSSRSLPSIPRIMQELQRASKYHASDADFTYKSAKMKLPSLPSAPKYKSKALQFREHTVDDVRKPSFTSRLPSLLPSRLPSIIVPRRAEHPVHSVMLNPLPPKLPIMARETAVTSGGKKKKTKPKNTRKPQQK